MLVGWVGQLGLPTWLPVPYGHFPGGKPEIMNAVALQGFTEIAATMSTASSDASNRARISAVVTGYLEFAAANPATYEAMFSLPISARFASDRSEAELKAAFASIASALQDHSASPRDVETSAELLWSALHGVATLERAHRLPRTGHQRRLDEMVDVFAHAAAPKPPQPAAQTRRRRPAR